MSKPGEYVRILTVRFNFLNGKRFTPSLVFVLSDFLAPFDYERSLKSLIKKHDVVPIVISDKREEVFPKTRGFVAIKDLETKSVKYLDLSKGLFANQQQLKLFSKLNLDYLTLMTDKNEVQWTSALSDYFDRRVRRRSRTKEMKKVLFIIVLCAFVFFTAFNSCKAQQSGYGQDTGVWRFCQAS